MAQPERSMVIVAKDANNNDVETTIKNLNTDTSVVTNLILKNFAQKLNSLTDNTYITLYVINQEQVI